MVVAHVVLAHIAGIPVEETLMMGAPPLTTGLAVLLAQWRARRREAEAEAEPPPPRAEARR